MKVYPNELTVIFFYNLCVSIMAAIVAIFTETNAGAWKIGLDTALASIVCSVRCIARRNSDLCSIVYANYSKVHSIFLGNFWFICEQRSSHMGTTYKGSCLCGNVQATLNCHSCCLGSHVPG